MKSENKILGADKAKWVRSAHRPVVAVRSNRDEEKDTADALLAEWHEWSAKYRPALGIPGCSPSSRQAQISKQFQSTAEIADESIRRITMENVEWCVDALTSAARRAIGVEMRNRASSAKVWRTTAGCHYDEAIAEIIPIMRRRALLG